jgi:hypothetical protein
MVRFAANTLAKVEQRTPPCRGLRRKPAIGWAMTFFRLAKARDSQMIWMLNDMG